jgi:hypothetical protein
MCRTLSKIVFRAEIRALANSPNTVPHLEYLHKLSIIRSQSLQYLTTEINHIPIPKVMIYFHSVLYRVLKIKDLITHMLNRVSI